MGGFQLAIYLGGRQFCQINKYCCSCGAWQTKNRIVRSPTGRRNCFSNVHVSRSVRSKPDISCEWNTKFSVIPEIPSKRVYTKRILKFSKTFPGIFTVPFSFGPEISEILVEWKAPLLAYGWSAGNLNRPIRIQQAGKILVS